MSKLVFNPCLPENEYIPDGEPYVFNGRLYVYGSHDRFNASIFCMNDYVCWSAPVTDLGDWKYEGVIYSKRQDPGNRLGFHLLFAPDVVQGADGRFYLYYSFDFTGTMGVAVCDSPCGRFLFLGCIRHPDGKKMGRKSGDPFMFDPGILRDDDGKIYLYSGFGIPVTPLATGGVGLESGGGYAMELEKDMLTVKGKPELIFPKAGPQAFLNHEFFEASSIRKYDGMYYFVYSSRHNHELCYAYSRSPVRDFVYGGTLVSNGDINVDKGDDEKGAANYTGNNHGGLLKLDGEYYIFYHRQTNRHSYSRQLCAEHLRKGADGIFLQAEMTSCGLNCGPLPGKGRYEARIACNLWSAYGTGRYDTAFSKLKYFRHPYFTQSGSDRNKKAKAYIANMRDGAVAGFKYFNMDGADSIEIEYRGKADGKIEVAGEKDFSDPAAVIPVKTKSCGKTIVSGRLNISRGKTALFFKFVGKGKIDFMAFTFC